MPKESWLLIYRQSVQILSSSANEFIIWFDRLQVFIFACDVTHIKLE